MTLLQSDRPVLCVLPCSAINDFYTDFLRLTSKAKLTNWENKQPEAVVIVVNVKTFSLDYIPQARGHKEPIYFILYYIYMYVYKYMRINLNNKINLGLNQS